jgi:mannose-6-phosphate isomerase-like protein (cupin superfamily)
MKLIKPKTFTGKRAWEAIDIAQIEGASIRLHWTDKPYIWHKNDGDEVFVVLDGQINMHYREHGVEHQQLLNPGDICYMREGEEHVAHPHNGPARILVIEKKGSI